MCIETDSETFSTINKAVNEYGEAWKATTKAVCISLAEVFAVDLKE